jgi:hypothetical protein
MQVHNAGLRITENPLHRGAWTKAGEAIGVPQSSIFSHPQIMTDFLTIKKAVSPS